MTDVLEHAVREDGLLDYSDPCSSPTLPHPSFGGPTLIVSEHLTRRFELLQTPVVLTALLQLSDGHRHEGKGGAGVKMCLKP